MPNRIIPLLFLLMSIMSLSAQEASTDSVKSEDSMDELNRQLENPLSRFWSIIFQENMSFSTGDLIQVTAFSNVFNFQPSLPVPVGKSNMLLVRPVFPLVSSPTFNQEGEKTGMETGLGDINVFSLFGPDKKDGLIWGVG